MKEYNNIDELFKDNVSDFTIEPEANTFNNIMSKTQTKKSYYREILSLLAILLLSGSIYLYFNYTSNNNIPITELSTNNKNINLENQKPIISEYKNETKSDNSASSKTQIEEVPAKYNVEENIKPITPSITEKTVEVINHTTIEKSHPETNTNTIISFKNDYQTLGMLNSKYDNNISKFEARLLTSNGEIIEIDDYVEKKRKFHIYTGVSASIGIMYYTDTPDQLTWSSDLNIGYTIKDFYIESGIGYQQVKQNGDYRIEYETNDSVGYYQQVLSFEVNPTNPEEIIYNTKTKTVYDSVGHYTHQSPIYQYDYINIPLVLGYKFFKKEKLTLSCETGIIYSILVSTKIPTVTHSNTESRLVDIINYTPNRVKNNLRLHLALRANYRINKGMSISLQPEFSSYLNSIYDKASNNKQRPYSVGIRAGLLFNF